MSITNPGAPESADALAKKAKELTKERVIKPLKREPAGLENTCVWGKHNPNYNSNSIKMW
jgi:hypothetical protein